VKLENQFPSVDGKYGAPMGRPNYGGYEGRPVEVFRVRAVDGGYDDGGAYWGDLNGNPLYCARNDFCQRFVRAKTREEAIALFKADLGDDMQIEEESRDLELCIGVTVEHFLIAAVWADSQEGTNPRVTREARENARHLVGQFLELCDPEKLYEQALDREADGYGAHVDNGSIEPAAAAFGHDLWLSIRGHGVGFSDRKALKKGGLGAKLQHLASNFGAFGAPEYEQHRGWFYLYL
jgi:hypothetical protein